MTQTTLAILDKLARLLDYPQSDFSQDVKQSLEALKAEYPEAAKLLAVFAEQLDTQELTGWEETYTATFDFNTECALEVGCNF